MAPCTLARITDALVGGLPALLTMAVLATRFQSRTWSARAWAVMNRLSSIAAVKLKTRLMVCLLFIGGTLHCGKCGPEISEPGLLYRPTVPELSQTGMGSTFSEFSQRVHSSETMGLVERWGEGEGAGTKRGFRRDRSPSIRL